MIVVLDACVLYPPSLRDLLLTLAALDAYDIRWSEEILDEVTRNVLEDNPDIDPERFVEHTIARMRAAFPEAMTHVDKTAVDQADNDPKDRHVAAVALAVRAQAIVTLNVKHFRGRALPRARIVVLTPGALVSQVLDESPEAGVLAVRIADQLRVGSFAALGWSGGGPFALATAAALGDRVSRVGLACAPGPFDQVPGALDGLDEPSRNALRLLPNDSEAAAAQFSVGSELLLSVREDETTFMDGMEALFGNADRSVVSDALLRHHLFVTMHEGLKQGFGGVAWDNVAWVGPWDVDLHAVRCPVHLWYGEADQSIPLVHGEWLAEHLHDTHLVVEPGAGHLWPLRRLRMMLRTITARR